MNTPTDCTPFVPQRRSESLVAPAAVEQGACTIPGQSGAGMLRDYMGRNRGAWLSIAAALDKSPLRDLSAHARTVGALAAASATAPGKRSAGAVAHAAALAASPSLPAGNHGENLNPALSQVAA